MSKAEELTKQCGNCLEVLPVSKFFWVSKASGRRRGQCKPCMLRRKQEQRNPDWSPKCLRCDKRTGRRDGSGGSRLCDECFAQSYDIEDRRVNGSHRVRLKPCTLCGGEKERFERGKMCVACKPWAGYAKSLRRFGLTPAEYVAILEAQRGTCYICEQPPKGERLSIDHDHTILEGRDAVRGLLCRDCNYSRLPRFAEDVALLQRAVDYLTTPPARAVIVRHDLARTSVTPADVGLDSS